jgi:hypothetical protein
MFITVFGIEPFDESDVLKWNIKPVIVVHPCNASTQEAEAVEL